MVAAFITHEVDAARRHEWRVLPITFFLPDKIGETVFIWAHLPLVFSIIVISGDDTQGSFRIGLAGFAMVHVGLHWLYRRHPAYQFNNLSSWALVTLTGLLGAIYLLLAAL
jgi:apolipoprotein N-acyltransferase